MDKMNLDQHISQQFNADLEDLKTQLLEMGGLVERQVADAVNAISNADSRLAETVLENEPRIDEYEVNIDEQCTTVLARRQPAAGDLRMVLAVSKTTRDLERMGDEAKKIAQLALILCEEGVSPRGYVELRHIGNSVLKMIHHTLDAFARYDLNQALTVAREDREVDREYKSTMRELMTYMMEDPRSISRVLNVMWALRSLERLGDHSRNIAEHLIYMVKGKDVRHVKLSELAKQIEG